MELYLIRHGEPQRLAPDQDRSDPGLSERGHLQARALAGYLADEHIDALVVSPMLRAQQTAAYVADATGLAPVIRADLAEFDRDAPEYLHFEDLAAKKDPRYDEFLADDLSAWGTDVESFRTRVHIELEYLIAAAVGERVAVVCHGGVVNVYIGKLVGTSIFTIHEPAYTGFSRVSVGANGVRELVSVNEAPHLRGLDLGIRAVVQHGQQ